MAMKGCTAFPKAGTSPSDCLVSYPGHSLGGGVLPLCRGAVGVFYSPSRLGKRHVGYCRRSKDELINNAVLWTPTHRHASIGQPPRTCLYQLCADTECRLEDLPGGMDDRDRWGEWESGKSVQAVWQWWLIFIILIKHLNITQGNDVVYLFLHLCRLIFS